MADFPSASVSFPEWALSIPAVSKKLEVRFGPKEDWIPYFDMDISDGIVSFTDYVKTGRALPSFYNLQITLQENAVPYDIWNDTFQGKEFSCSEKTVCFRPELKKEVTIVSGGPLDRIKDLREYKEPVKVKKAAKASAH